MESIFQGNQLLSQGTKWIIGNGKHVRAWEDKWLNETQPKPARCINEGISPDLRVSEFMIPETATWDNTKLTQLVNSKDIPKIQLIKPSISGVEDQITWSYTKDGVYSVKSGYHFLHSPNYTLTQQADKKILKT